ncbi:hypothetical protein N836_31500 [Leptolyngbya sp. Heron Island J]|uniref:hypothetical protein n=1 Tax=Leptolyngbya sp. Heron Island J TaxID=1385935 RepID=UPI0003B9BB89|nr:hypothetical protein [Leptolyngbya sp. Heron Island J]ESA38468.1 hypothetical protein N836_31500 [Leptolyngbya sp. Heron Island J]
MSGEIIEFRNIADEITIRESDGVAIVSIKAAARLAGKEPGSLRYHFNGGQKNKSELAVMLENKGFDGGQIFRFSEEGVPDQALGVILKYYAYKAGKRCTVQAEYACDQFQEMGIRATCYAAKGLVQIQSPTDTEIPATASKSTLALPSPKEVVELTRYILEPLTLGKTEEQSKSLKAGAEISAVQALYPELSPALKPAQSMLAATNTVDAEDIVWLTPTSLGKYLGLSAVKVNRALTDMGLQIKVDKPAKGEPKYLPTEWGQEYGRMTTANGSDGDMTTYQHLKWSKRVLEVFDGGVAA